MVFSPQDMAPLFSNWKVNGYPSLHYNSDTKNSRDLLNHCGSSEMIESWSNNHELFKSVLDHTFTSCKGKTEKTFLRYQDEIQF